MTIEVYARMIRDIGFPIVVSGFLLWFLVTRLDPSIGRLTDTMVEFKRVMERQAMSFDQARRLSEENNERLRQLMGDTPWNRARREPDQPDPHTP